jgi:hypothetical protein
MTGHGDSPVSFNYKADKGLELELDAHLTLPRHAQQRVKLKCRPL